MYVEYVFYSLKHNNSFILYLKRHKIRATSFVTLLTKLSTSDDLTVACHSMPTHLKYILSM
jgi:hypothetical protein